ncbi:MAG: peptidase M15 [Alistipes sp.]|jgi:hypothetical protein|nr:peptidase M15 [Alistipes sp.]
MARYFTLDELTLSATAARLGIDNTPPTAAVERLETLAERLLDPVRELWGGPLAVNSGYRCPALNAAVGGAAGSQHMAGEAADITTGSTEGNRRLFGMISGNGRSESGYAENSDHIDNFIEFDQLIDESGYRWLHLSYREGRNRNQILHL